MGNAKSSYASKSHSSGNTSKRVHWDGPGLPSPPGKPILVPGTEDSQPDVVGIRWERSPSNGGSAIIGYLVEHRRMGSPHWVRSAPVLCTFPELTLSGLEPGWRYQFRVRAQNALGLSRPSELSDPLTVTLQRSAACAPKFDQELQDTVALENDQAEFTVKFSGTPLPKISWFKDGFEIFSSRRTRIITENGKSTLLIHQTALNDEGEIKCTATNRAGHVGTKAKLMLEAPPRIRLPRQYEDGLLFEQDETIRLKVSLAGRPSPKVTWYHDGEVIEKDERHVFENMEGEGVLKIPDAKRKDRGEYTVRATNKLGEDVTSFLVTVTDRPAAPGKALVTMTLGRTVTLSWKEPEDDGGCKIGTYIVEYYRLGWDVWLKAATCRQTTTTLSELIEGSEYRFRVKAENPYGVSEPSEESDVVFIPDPKRGITAPPLSGKSQSHREIHRRSEKREVNFVEPTLRTRSLTREESRMSRGAGNEGRFSPPAVSSSAQKLPSVASIGGGRPSRADSRVTFALDAVMIEGDSTPGSNPKSVEDSVDAKMLGAYLPKNSTIKKDTKAVPKQGTGPKAVVPPFDDSGGKETPSRHARSRSRSRSGSRSRSVSFSRDRRSLSPEPMLGSEETKNAEKEEEDRGWGGSTWMKTDSKNDIRSVSVERYSKENPSMEGKLILDEPSTARDDYDADVHGSSEFMLVLYPDEGEKEEEKSRSLETTKTTFANEILERVAEDEDLVAPPMSLSLPELFSPDHELIETIREAVSSTELLHERAMERFYRAVAVEEAAEFAKQKAKTERNTGELASAKEFNRARHQSEGEPVESRRSDFKKRFPNSSNYGSLSWQLKKSRRRSSEGQAVEAKLPLKLLQTVHLEDVEAHSDPNLPRVVGEKLKNEKDSEEMRGVERLRRWHEGGMSLIPDEAAIADDDVATENLVEAGPNSTGPAEDEISISSEDSADLKSLKSRILAQNLFDEEDTYNPRGKPIVSVTPEPPPVPQHQIPIVQISPPVPSRASPFPTTSNVQPKSILKKRPEEPIPVNSFGRPIPPEKPVRKQLPQESKGTLVSSSAKDESSSEQMKPPDILSEAGTDILSAAEVAKNRRRKLKRSSSMGSEEDDMEDFESRMAVINHYTEIMREHAKSKPEEEVIGRPSTPRLVPRRELVQEENQHQHHRVLEDPDKPKSKRNGIPSVRPASGRTTPSRRSEDPSPARRPGDRSRSSSRTRAVGSRPPSRTEIQDQGRRSRKSSRPSSRSSSRDRTSNSLDKEKLLRALERKRLDKSVAKGKIESQSTAPSTSMDLVATEKRVRSTMSYLTDLALLLAAVYVYLFKRATFAVPFIALLLYRRIQEEIHGIAPNWWKSNKRKPGKD